MKWLWINSKENVCLGNLGILKLVPTIEWNCTLYELYIYTHTHTYGTLQDSLLFDCLCVIITKLPLLYGTLQDSKLFACLCVIATQVAFYYDDCMAAMFSHVVHVANHQRPRSIKGFKSNDSSERKGKEGKGSNKTIWRKHPPSFLLLGPLRVT